MDKKEETWAGVEREEEPEATEEPIMPTVILTILVRVGVNMRW